MKRVIINGADGKMGQAILRLLAENPQLGLTLAGRRGPADGFDMPGDIIIDFSSAQGAQEAFNWAKQHKAACLIGTTNLPESFLFQMQEERKIPLFYAPNVSLSVYFFGELLKRACKLYAGYQKSMHEIHHAQKKDAPSGTAKKLAELIDFPVQDISYERIGTVPGTHSLSLANTYDKITLTHEALNRDLFASSALHIAAWLVHCPAGFYSMPDYAKFILKQSKKRK